MVEKMKKLTILIPRSDSFEFIDDLQELGVVHLSTEPLSGNVALSELDDELRELKKTLTLFQSVRKSAEFREPYPVRPVSTEVATVLKDVHEIQARKASLEARKARLLKDKEILIPWGQFDAGILSKLQESHLHIRFHSVPETAFPPEQGEKRHFEIIGRDKKTLHLIEIYTGTGNPPLYPEEKLPAIGLGELEASVNQIQDSLCALNDRLLAFSASETHFLSRIALLEKDREKLLAQLSLVSEAKGALVRLSGYVPVSLVATTRTFLDKHCVLGLFDDPQIPIETPIRLKNGPFARLFEPITRIFGLPSYVEIDTTPFLAPFFAFFFGMCLADAGYGIIVTVAAAIGYCVLKKKSLRSLAALAFVLGLMTIVGGLFLNTFFGMKLDSFPRLPQAVRDMLLFKDIDAAMAFSVMLGIIQILFGFALQISNKIRQDGVLASLQPAGTFLLIAAGLIYFVGKAGSGFAVGPIPVGLWIAGLGNTRVLGLGLGILGILLILFFNNPGKKFWIRPLTGIWEMYGIASGLPGDILSYIRLFALSLAGGLLGGAINLIAMMVRGDNPGILSGFFMVLVLVSGHAVNFALAALGAFVHPLRLTFVEFYKAVGFVGGGKQYKAFGGKTI